MSRSRGTIAISTGLIGLGLAVIIRTVTLGVGGGVGLIVGGMLVAAGALRIYLVRR